MVIQTITITIARDTSVVFTWQFKDLLNTIPPIDFNKQIIQIEHSQCTQNHLMLTKRVERP